MHIIRNPLTFIINCSLTTGIFPERCKLAIVRPIHKNGNKNEMNNYRPISLLTTISKIFERVMYNRLVHHFESNNYLTTVQYGFQKELHIENAVFSLLNRITTLLDKRQHVGGIFCDLTKAFDCVNHNILLHKLQYYGIKGNSLSWIKSYLGNRKQKVCLLPNVLDQEASSKWKAIINGVPQGSILGPLLFIIYLNDLPYGLKQDNLPVICADDTGVLLTAENEPDLKNKINDELDYLVEWFSANGLVLNMEKTNLMKFTLNTRQNEPFQIIYQNNLLNGLNNTKFLGLELDKNVNWKNHIQKILPKLSSACYLIRRLYPSCNLNTLMMVYFAYFHTVMEYGIIFCGDCGK